MFIHTNTSLGIFRSPRFNAADDGKGGSNPAPEKPRSLAAANDQIATLQTDLAAANKRAEDAAARADSAEQERNNLQVQFDSATTAATTLTTERDQARTELATANTTIGTLTTERDQARADLGKAQANQTRLEKLCGVHGVDPKAAAPDLGEQAETNDLDAIRAEIATTTDPTRLAELGRKARELRGV